MNSEKERSQEPEFRSQKIISGWWLGGRGSIHRTRFGSDKSDPYIKYHIKKF
ncbi:hypothetical protein KJ599_07310 [bacterium]|nr:hypothetical protein [bacterium]